MHNRLSALLVAAGAVAALASCGDPTAIKARLTNFETKRAVYALNGTPGNVPVALQVRRADIVPASANFLFDIAFDLTPEGFVRLYTAKSLATELPAALNRVGLRDSPELVFDNVIDPPRDLFIYDSLLTVPVGRTVLIDVVDQSCQTEFLLGFNIKAKLKVDSVNTAERVIYIHAVINPNCGFRELVKGGELPKE